MGRRSPLQRYESPLQRYAHMLPVAGLVLGTLAVGTVMLRGSIIGGTYDTSGVPDSGSWTGGSSSVRDLQPLKVRTWNVAAINNNPFEYWITLDQDPSYGTMMDAVQSFIDAPGLGDVRVDTVFTPAMWRQLKAKMIGAGWSAAFVGATEVEWSTNYAGRRIVSEFMKDETLGLKRLVSMPDRYTNTINVASGGRAYRPSVINCYSGADLSTVAKWYVAWTSFIFDAPITTIDRKTGVPNLHTVASVLTPIKRSKYPAISEAEAKISVPLQTLTLAIFDAILVHIVNTLGAAPSSTTPFAWQPLRSQICSALNLRKTARTIEILGSSYNSDADVIFLQECATSFADALRRDRDVGSRYSVIVPAEQNKRDQNSLILLKRARFPTQHVARAVEVSASVLTSMKEAAKGGKIKAAAGDVLATIVTDVTGAPFMLASFHGDTNGLATIPVTQAVRAVHRNAVAGAASAALAPRLVFGLDANTYEHSTPGKTQDVLEFARAFHALGLTSCWGGPEAGGVTPSEYTTFSARTFLQPQLNKAARRSELKTKGDVNPKDFVLFDGAQWSSTRCAKDNTGEGRFVEQMVFPTLAFPSDHGILKSELTPR